MSAGGASKVPCILNPWRIGASPRASLEADLRIAHSLGYQQQDCSTRLGPEDVLPPAPASISAGGASTTGFGRLLLVHGTEELVLQGAPTRLRV